jgi:cyanophycinase-like exopeptidase
LKLIIWQNEKRRLCRWNDTSTRATYGNRRRRRQEKDCRILKEFVRLSGGEKAHLVVMTTATELPEEVAAEYTEVFNRLGVKDVQAMTFRNVRCNETGGSGNN